LSQHTPRHDITKKAVLYEIEAMDRVSIRHDVQYRAAESEDLTMDIYYPDDSSSTALPPAIVFVFGYSDLGCQARLGCKQKEMASYISWARLAAASGLAAITYSNLEPVSDVRVLIDYIRQNGHALGIDGRRIGVWACSGNVPLALSLLIQESAACLKCAVLCYGFMLDLDGSTGVAEAARQWGFVNPCTGKSVDAFPGDVPLLVVRAGQDEFPHLNEAIDRFLAAGLARNLPITFVNHAAAPHAFDLMHEGETTREIIRQILAFMRFHLRESNAAVGPSGEAVGKRSHGI
jgi:acetyl esterase/lipase